MVDEILKKNIDRLYNVLAFYQLYQNETQASSSSKNVLDMWIISRLNEVIKNITEGYENYRVDLATRPLVDFIDDFSVWYLRRSRERFKEDNDDKKDALATLKHVLLSISAVMAPAMPFFAEHIYQQLKTDDMPESVHLCDWPKIENKKINKDLEEKMEEVRFVVNLALGERIVKGIKVKQPLALLKIKNDKLKIKNDKDFLALIKDETNIKEIIFDNKIEKDVELDINITEELKMEGMERELIRSFKGGRKDIGLLSADTVSIAGTNFNLSTQSVDKLKKEVGAENFVISEPPEDANFKKEITIDGKNYWIFIKK